MPSEPQLDPRVDEYIRKARPFAQPILIDCAHGQIALCHNGNIVNARELRDDLVA